MATAEKNQNSQVLYIDLKNMWDLREVTVNTTAFWDVTR
jgi:hypothetical protein